LPFHAGHGRTRQSQSAPSNPRIVASIRQSFRRARNSRIFVNSKTPSGFGCKFRNGRLFQFEQDDNRRSSVLVARAILHQFTKMRAVPRAAETLRMLATMRGFDGALWGLSGCDRARVERQGGVASARSALEVGRASARPSILEKGGLKSGLL